jgi:hypothetical protein
MSNKINIIEVNDDMQKILTEILSVNDVSKHLENNCWIAGGFARIISDIAFNNFSNKSIMYILKYLCKGGDIDIFSNSAEYMDNIKSDLEKDKNSKTTYNLPYTANIETTVTNVIRPLKRNLNVDLSPEILLLGRRSVKTQFVNKFIFKDIKETFESFDFSNSKFAIDKKNSKYRLHYTDKSLFFRDRKVLNIERIVSPMLASRMFKYNKKYNFNIVNNSKLRSNIKEYLFKLISGSWPNAIVSYDDFYLTKLLHNAVTLESNELCLLLGMFSCSVGDKVSSGYGFYYENIREVDWALNEMSE